VRIILVKSVLLFLFVSCSEKDPEIVLIFPVSGGIIWKPTGYDYNKDYAKYAVLKKWGFSFQSRGGCIPLDVVTRDSLKVADFKMYRFIAKKYGKNWIQDLSKEVKTTFLHLKVISKKLDTLSFVKQREDKLKKIKHDIVFSYQLDENPNYIVVTARDFNLFSNDDAIYLYTAVEYSHFKVTFDVRNYSVVSIQDSIEIIPQKDLYFSL
jgi:hypothetical protein